MGSGFPIDAFGGPSTADFLISELSGPHNRKGQGFLSTMPPEMGHSGSGICERDGLHPFKTSRNVESSLSVPSTGKAFSAGPKPKEEVSQGKGSLDAGRRAIPRSELEREVGTASAGQPPVSPLLSPAPLPSSSMSVRALCSAARGRGRQVAPAGQAAWPSSSGGLDLEADDEGSSDGGVSSLRQCSLSSWPNFVFRNLLRSKTPFAWFVHKAILHCRVGTLFPSTTALFPIPLPRDDVWSVVPKHRSKACRLRRAYRKMLHLVILALNYLHFASPLNVVHLLGRSPSDLHMSLFARLMALIKAGGPVEKVSIFNCGRKAFQLDARFNELVEAVQSLGLDSAAQYKGGSSEVSVPTKNEKDELRPYRELCAERLKLSGSGQWDPVPFLSDLFYMPYLEPRVNQFDIRPPREVLPDLSRVDRNEVLKLCKVWDLRGLLRIFPEHCGPKHRWGLVKVFNNYKSEHADRQIGDRRGMNFCEGRISGPSKTLPTATSLLQLCPKRFREMLSCGVTDRRDFYHQFRVSNEKACGNALFPPFSAEELCEFSAFQTMREREAAHGRISDRHVVGDRFGLAPRSILVESERYVACFGALYQGDHLGVEFATDAHANLMKSCGLLDEDRRLQGSTPILYDDICSGLIIDDMFFISREQAQNLNCLQNSKAVGKLLEAKRAYTKEGLLGSDDKDVLGNVVFKVCGAEVDSSWRSVQSGVVLAGTPREKRLALGALSSAAASLRFTSDALHACLVGSWVSTLLMRRQAMAALNEVFHVIPADELNPEKPRLWRMTRAAADELALLSCLAPIICSNLATPFSRSIYATDASLAKGGIVEADVDESLSALIWRSADRSGQNVPMLRSTQAMLSVHDRDFEHDVGQTAEVKRAEESLMHVQRPLGLRFQFLEVCGGAGVVTRKLIEKGGVCGPVFDLSISPHFNLLESRVLEWIIFMMEEDRLDSFLVSPPCTSFSPAAHPMVRSYDQPRGFDPDHPKVLLGNLLAFAALTLLLAALRLRKFGLGEQPRLSKMRWLREWLRLVMLGAREVWLASCAYGSVHRKEFGMIGVNMKVELLHRKCPGNHQHIKIEGKYTKPSAVYCDGLADALAEFFLSHLSARQRAAVRLQIDVDGLEDPLSNDLCTGLEWSTVDSWSWKANSHINVLETAATLRLFRRVARNGGDVRVTYLADSHVSRSVVAKGRSASGALQQMLKSSAAICLAFGILPAGRFAPTRLNPADHPTRNSQIPPAVDGLLSLLKDARALWILSSKGGIKRWASNWVRFVILLSPSVIWIHCSASSLRRHASSVISNSEWEMDFDSTLGFPGEGPSNWTFLWIFILTLLSVSLPSRAVARARGESHGDALRRQQRAGIVLEDGRRVTATTSFHRESLLEKFRNWLDAQGDNFDSVVMSSPPDLENLNQKLVDYGRWLFGEGKPYYHFSETVNAVTNARPLVRRSLQQAWDLAFLWNSHEPAEHHIAVPFQILIALISASFIWGWRREGAIFALAFGALLRMGEVTCALRRDLVLPSDVGETTDYVLLRISEPKTRYRAARHQAAKLEQVDLIEVVKIGFGKLQPHEPLWNFSNSTLRSRLLKLLDRLSLPTRDSNRLKAISLASFRPGGATWLMTATESAELVRRRGRWASFRIMEVYLQEVMAVTYMNEISKDAYCKVMQAFAVFGDVLAAVQKFDRACMPEATWFFFISHQPLDKL